MHCSLLMIVTLACASDPRQGCCNVSHCFHWGYPQIQCQCMQPSSSNTVRQRPVSHGSAPGALPFKCIACNSNFAKRSAANSLHRHQVAQGTPCADPTSLTSQSITTRPQLSTGILRQHDAGPISEITCTQAL